MTPAETARAWMAKAEAEFADNMEAERKTLRLQAGCAVDSAAWPASRANTIRAIGELQAALAAAHRWIALDEARSILGMDSIVDQLEELEGVK